MTLSQIIIESLGKGPQSLPQLACSLHTRGAVRIEFMYAEARKVVRELQDAGRIEQCGEGLNTCWRLPAKTPMETTGKNK